MPCQRAREVADAEVVLLTPDTGTQGRGTPTCAHFRAVLRSVYYLRSRLDYGVGRYTNDAHRASVTEQRFTLMFDQFPVELVILVFSEAAKQFVTDERQTVVNLALTSRMVHDHVAPTLYKSMYISQRNVTRIEWLSKDLIARTRVLHLVRRLCLIRPGTLWHSATLVGLSHIFPHLHAVTADLDGILWLNMKPSLYPHLRHLRSLSNAAIVRDTEGLPDGLTHLTIGMHYPWVVRRIDARFTTGWMPQTLTHLAIDVLWLHGSPRITIERICAIRCLHVIAFFVATTKRVFDSIVRVAHELQDRRLFGWYAARQGHDADILHDFLAERDGWTEAICLLDVQLDDMTV